MARRRVLQGPAHALIFPNLFLGETNIAIVEPVEVESCVHWHTPMFLTGVPEFNGRLLRMAEAGMGPASFLMPDDLVIAGPEHPIRSTGDAETPAIYLGVRHGTEARLNRSTYLQLVEIALAGGGDLRVSSQGASFSLVPA